ncbi:conserved exported hypothetical protein [uncultured Stenotrophomonas sp.]|uniref:Secreted protein n=1 Tax=uncultured Stenotrophomonas sp. TaxID=165438 RepID=A0A1Y5PZF5_9GAMM|nr:conserved exported hypothetical protein [uncultured Stenotrophomonas sp.]
MNIEKIARAVPVMLLVALLTACSGGLSGEYGQEVNGEWDTTMTFKGDGEVEIDMGIAQVVGKYEVKDGKLRISMSDGTPSQAFVINDKGCIEGGMLFGTLCKKK